MSIKNRIKRLEVDICPPNKKFGVLISNYRNSLIGRNNYMRNSKPIGYISSVLEWANGKIIRMVNAGSEEGRKMLKELDYKIIGKEASV